MFLLDTNIISESVKRVPNPRVISWLNQRPPGSTFISAVLIAEIEFGLATMPDGLRKEQLIAANRKAYRVFQGACASFDALAAYEYARIRAARQRTGRPITYHDAQVAAIAITAGLTLATRNTKDFDGIEGLKVVDPFA